MDINKISSVCETVLRRIGERMRENFSDHSARAASLGVSLKGPADFVTEIDMWAEAQVAEAVQTNFPDHLLIGEETSDQLLANNPGSSLADLSEKGLCWIVDPIDGTANFVSGAPLSVVSVGVLQDGELLFGMVYDPARDELFSATRDKGAYLNGVKIHVSPQDDPTRAVVATGFAHDRMNNWEKYKPAHESLLTSVGKVRMLGSTALEMCLVACGRLDGFVQQGPKSWDVAGSTIIVTEAGGRVGSIPEPVDDPYSIFSQSVIASNGKLHARLHAIANPQK